MISHQMLLFLSAVFTGVERGGIPGLAPVAVTTLLATSDTPSLGRRMIGLLLPVYCASDLCACYIYKESIRWDILRELVLPVAVGMFFAFLTLGGIGGEDVRTILGVTIAALLLLLSIVSVIERRKSNKQADDVLPLTVEGTGSAPGTPLRTPKKGASASSSARGNSPSRDDNQRGNTALTSALVLVSRPLMASSVFRGGLGCMVGYLTVVANVSGLVLILALLAMNLPARAFNGTRSALLLICNGCKLPGQLLLGTIQLTLSDLVVMTPLILAGVLCTWGTEKILFRRLDQTTFEIVIWVLMSLMALKLIFIF
jgi:hypothetical protein